MVAVIASVLGLGVVSASATPPTPSNDNFASRQVLTDAAFAGPSGITGTTAGATAEAGDPVDLGGHSVWFEWTAGASGTLRLNDDGPPWPQVDTFVMKPGGSTVADLNEVGPSGRTMNIHEGTTYFFGVGDSVVGGYPPGSFSISGSFPVTPDEPQYDSGPNSETLSHSASFTFSTPYESGLTFECRLDPANPGDDLPAYAPCTSPKSYPSVDLGPHYFQVRAVDAGGLESYSDDYAWLVLAVPANDDVAHAQVLPGDSGNTTGNMLGSTLETDEQVITGETRSVWYAWTPSTSGSAHFNGCCYISGRVYTSAVGSPTSVSQLTLVDDNNPDFVATEGTTYYWQIQDPLGSADGNDYSLSWSLDQTLAEPGLFGYPSSLTLDTSASFDFSSTELGVTYECRIDPADPLDDSTGFDACTSPASYSGLSREPHVFQVRAVDTYGDTSKPAQYNWTIQDAPGNDAFVNRTTITGDTGQIDGSTLGATVEDGEDAPDGQQSVWYEWTPSGDGTGHLSNTGWLTTGVFTSDVDTPTLSDLHLLTRDSDFVVHGGTTYYVQIEDWYDWLPVNFTLYWDDNSFVDSPYFTGYPDPETLQHTATFKWDDSEVGVHYACRLDAATPDDPFTACTSGLTTDTLSAGSHTFEVEALDSANNVSNATPYTWTIATAPGNDLFANRATISGDSGTVDSTLFGATTETGEPPSLGDSTVWYQWTPGTSGTAHISGPYFGSVQLFTASGTPAVGTLTSYGVDSHDYSVAAGTTYYIGVGDGIWGPEDFTLSWSIDNAVVQPSFSQTPAATTRHTDAQFTWGDTEAGVTYLCRLDLGSFDACPADGQLAALSVGSHTFAVEAVDAGGNTSNSAQFTWQILDPIAIPTIFNYPSDPTTSTTAQFGIRDDTSGVGFECRLDSTDVNDFAPCINGVSYSSLATTSHTFDVRATDADGDVSGVQSYTWTILPPGGSSTTTLESDHNPSVFGQSVTLTATVTPTGGSSSGSVDFTENGSPLGSASVSGGKASISLSSLSVGSHPITATYTPDGAAGVTGSSSDPLSQVVNQASTTTSLSTSVSPSKFGQPVSLTATVAAVSPGAGTPTGSVTFFEGSTALNTLPLNAAGKAIFTTAGLGVGTHQVTATYVGSTSFLSSSTSSALSQVVQKSDTTIGLVTDVTPSVYGQSVTFTATVLPVIPGSGTRTGTVTFKDGSATLGTGSVAANGQASFTTALPLSVGDHSITAVYGGDGNFNGATSDALTQTVHKASTTTTLSSSVNPSVYRQSVQLTATVAPVSPGAGGPTGTVTFKEGSTELVTATLDSSGHATFTSSLLSVGTHQISATYNGDGNFESSSTASALAQVVNKGSTTTSLGSSVNPSVFGQSVTLTATVAPVSPSAGTPGGTVTFKEGSTELVTANLDGTGHATLISSAFAVGTHQISATYNGDGNFLTSSTASTLGQVVNKASTTTGVSSDTNPATVGQLVTLTAHVSAVAPGAGSPGGTVAFKEGTTTLHTSNVDSSGVASWATSTLAGGSHNITAVYSGDGSFLTSTSGALSQTVSAKTSSTSLSCTPVAGTRKTAYTCTASVTPTSPMPTGTVTFTAGKTLVTSTLSGGTATGSLLRLRPATYNVTATYNGDSNYARSTSSPVTITVAKK